MNTNGKQSVIAASLALPVAFFVSSVVGWYFKSRNPDNVDITAELAYLRPILVSGFVVFGFLMVLAFVSGLRGKKHDQDKTLSNIGVWLVVVLTVLTLTAGIANSATSRAQDAYKTAHPQPFFPYDCPVC